MIDGRVFEKLEELEKARLDKHLQLVLEDAPKNKFTVISAQIAMLREIRDELMTLTNQSRNSP